MTFFWPTVTYLKTGTLTEGGLEFCGVASRSKEENIFDDLVRDPALQLKQDDPVLVTLAACHTLTRIEGFPLFFFLNSPSNFLQKLQPKVIH